jgi:hypothetical protein
VKPSIPSSALASLLRSPMPCVIRSRWSVTARIGEYGALVVDTYGRFTGLVPPHAITRRAAQMTSPTSGSSARMMEYLHLVVGGWSAPRLSRGHLNDRWMVVSARHQDSVPSSGALFFVRTAS